MGGRREVGYKYNLNQRRRGYFWMGLQKSMNQGGAVSKVVVGFLQGKLERSNKRCVFI